MEKKVLGSTKAGRGRSNLSSAVPERAFIAREKLKMPPNTTKSRSGGTPGGVPGGVGGDGCTSMLGHFFGIFRSFFEFGGDLFNFFDHLRSKLRFETIFFDFSSIFHGFW